MSSFPLDDDDDAPTTEDGDNRGNGDARLHAFLHAHARGPEIPSYADVGADLTGPDAERSWAVHGRAAEIAAVHSILARRLPPFCPILVGPEGVGRKTVAVAALRSLHRGGDDVPTALRGWSARMITAEQLRAAPRNDRDVLGHAVRDHVLLLLDRLEDWVASGSPNPWEGTGYSDLLASLLRGGLRFVAVAGPALPRLLAGSRNPIARFLEPVSIGELPPDDLLAAARAHVPLLAAEHGVRVRGDEAGRAWAAARESGSPTLRFVLQRIDRDLAARACGRDQLVLVGSDPAREASTDAVEKLQAARRVLREEFQGQDRAIDAICDLLLHRLGPLAPSLRRPRAVVLLLGPSGTGKTSVARRLGELLFGPGRVFALSLGELGPEPQAASYRILGAPIFYQGGSWGTSLCEQVSGAPRSCVILDELERAFVPYQNMVRPPVLDMLFSALGEPGKLTDALGSEVSFAGTVVFLTSNVRACKPPAPGRGLPRDGDGGHASGALPDPNRGLQPAAISPPPSPHEAPDSGLDRGPGLPEISPDQDDEHSAALRALEATPGMSVEFLNRVNRIVVFRPLDSAACSRLADRLLSDFAERCARAGCLLEWDPGLPSALGILLADPRYNARFAGRRFETLVEIPVGRLLPAKRVRICVEDGRPVPVVVAEVEEHDLRLS